LLVDGPAITAVDVAGTLRVTVVTVAVVVNKMTTIDFIFGVLTVVGLVEVVATSMDFEVEARTIDVAAMDGVGVVLSVDDVVVAIVSSSEMTTVSGKSNSISGSTVAIAGVVGC